MPLACLDICDRVHQSIQENGWRTPIGYHDWLVSSPQLSIRMRADWFATIQSELRTANDEFFLYGLPCRLDPSLVSEFYIDARTTQPCELAGM